MKVSQVHRGVLQLRMVRPLILPSREQRNRNIVESTSGDTLLNYVLLHASVARQKLKTFFVALGSGLGVKHGYFLIENDCSTVGVRWGLDTGKRHSGVLVTFLFCWCHFYFSWVFLPQESESLVGR